MYCWRFLVNLTCSSSSRLYRAPHHVPEVLLRGGHADLEPGKVCCISWKGVPVVEQGVEVAGVSC